jgi:tetraacyldisaccharide 4'-kinase
MEVNVKIFKQAPFFWYRRDTLSRVICYLLSPFSWLYWVVVVVRRFLYASGCKKVTSFPVPVIVVGNITVGGTGKTPLVIWLAKFLRARGKRVGIVSYGYGSKGASYPIVVDQNSDVGIVGDEALLIAQKTGCLVVIDVDRVAAAKKLLQESPCDVIISDDGLQHYALGRTIEIAVVDESRGFGNGFCLPAGPLREMPSRLKRVDVVVTNRLIVSDSEAGGVQSVSSAERITNSMSYVVDQLQNLQKGSLCRSLAEMRGRMVHAVAGIGNPEKFFQMLRQAGLEVCPHVFPDHHKYVLADLEFFDDLPVVMTEKDAVKCMGFAGENWWFVRLDVEVSADFSQWIAAKMKV